MIFAQFYQTAVYPVVTDKIIEACGDRAVIILDGRNSSDTHHAISAAECKKRGYIAYSVHAGESFSRSRTVSSIIRV
jgi:hypothetical protein